MGQIWVDTTAGTCTVYSTSNEEVNIYVQFSVTP